ncbi:MAG: hypothetical protein IKV91_00005, partial [Bacteroidales bacterium]|nr:hypothetical protein [Bacteroidales bacterium]
NVKNMVAVNCSDDSFDWTEGWNGRGENLVAFQAPESVLGYDCDCLVESDNNENNFAATPVSHPVLSNLVLVGNGAGKQGIRLRRGTQVEITSAKVTGKGKPLAVESAETENALLEKVSRLSGVAISGTLDSKEGIYTNDKFVADGNTSNATLGYASLEDIAKECSWMNGWTR